MQRFFIGRMMFFKASAISPLAAAQYAFAACLFALQIRQACRAMFSGFALRAYARRQRGYVLDGSASRLCEHTPRFFRCFAHLRFRAPSLNGGQTAAGEQFRAQNSEPRFQSKALLTQKSDLSAWIGRALRASEINSCEKRLLWVKRRRFMRRRFLLRGRCFFFVGLQKDV